MLSISPVPVCLFVVFSSCLLFGQESKQKPENDSLPYVPQTASKIVVIRPANILGSRDYRDLESVAGDDVKKIVQRLRNRYLKYGLADLEEIDSLIFAEWVHVHELEGGDLGIDGCAVMILKTVDDNADRFGLATHAVEKETEFQGTTIFTMKQPLDGSCHYACIMDDRSIAWAASIRSLEDCITAGKTDASKAAWYRSWQKFENARVSLVVVLNREEWAVVPPALTGMDGLQFVTGGANPAKSEDLRAFLTPSGGEVPSDWYSGDDQ